jgi:antitoxin (DNA-binding transcriptional repressor) of toxin-antitoxin stability system
MFMVMNPIMININEAKTHLSKYARRVRRGEIIILCSRNRPFAEIRPLPEASPARRPFGLARGRLGLPEDLGAPDAEVEALFAGTGQP